MERDNLAPQNELSPHHNILATISFVKGLVIGVFFLAIFFLAFLLQNKYGYLEKIFPQKREEKNVLAVHDIVSYSEIQSNLKYIFNNSAVVLNGMKIRGDIDDGSDLNLEGEITLQIFLYC
jgi:hypothetical protein